MDDISLDVKEKDETKAARNVVLAYQQSRNSLQGAGHKPSDSKTSFLASNAKAAKALNSRRQEGDPEVKNVGVDLGMSTTAARARTSAGQKKRLTKAGQKHVAGRAFLRVWGPAFLKRVPWGCDM